jgi:hypothetical protein
MFGDRPQNRRTLGAAGVSVIAITGLGAGLAWGFSWDLDRSNAVSRLGCAGSSGICFGIAPLIGLAVAVIGLIAACWLFFAMLDLRPLTVGVPAAIALAFFTTWGFQAAVPGGRLHPTWVFILVMSLGFALLAVAMVAGPRLRIAVALLLGILLSAAILSGETLHRRLQERASQHVFASLRVPLLTPALPDYRLLDAYASGGDLVLDLVDRGTSTTPRGAYAQGKQFQILILPNPNGFRPPSTCMGDVQPAPGIDTFDGPPPPCLPAGPNRWSRHGGDVVQLIEHRGSAIIEAGGSATAVGQGTLTRALDTLRPTTAAALATKS